MTAGVYEIKNTATGRSYIGISKNIEKRARRHLQELRNGQHARNEMQEDADRQGLSAFEVWILSEGEATNNEFDEGRFLGARIYFSGAHSVYNADLALAKSIIYAHEQGLENLKLYTKTQQRRIL